MKPLLTVLTFPAVMIAAAVLTALFALLAYIHFAVAAGEAITGLPVRR